MNRSQSATTPRHEKELAGDHALQRRLLVMSTLMMAIAAIFWGGLYYHFREPYAALIPWVYTVISFLSLAILRKEEQHWILRDSQLFLSLVLPFLVMWELGGFVGSSGVVIWSLICPMGAVVFVGRKAGFFWFLGFLFLVVIGAAIGFPSVSSSNELPSPVIVALFVMNLSGVSIVAFVLLSYFVGQKDMALNLLAAERERSESLLRNMLPAAISERLKQEQRPIADRLEGVTTLFADISGFTEFAMKKSPEEIVTLLDSIFSRFDEISRTYGLEKIKTIGDAYMVCGGLDGDPAKGALATVGFAVEAMNYLQDMARKAELPLGLRIGLNTGPIVAGVIGQSKYSYDIWGDSVNVAARLQENADPGTILVSAATRELAGEYFTFRSIGNMVLKGHSPVEAFVLTGQAKS